MLFSDAQPDLTELKRQKTSKCEPLVFCRFFFFFCALSFFQGGWFFFQLLVRPLFGCFQSRTISQRLGFTRGEVVVFGKKKVRFAFESSQGVAIFISIVVRRFPVHCCWQARTYIHERNEVSVMEK
jgi:hypothetical protein